MNFLRFYAIKTFWWSNKKRIEGKNNIKTISYPRRESNPDQQFRKLLFYPLNYGDSLFSGCKDKQIILFRFFFAILYLFIPAEVITIAYFINFAMDFVRYGTIYSQTNQPPAG